MVGESNRASSPAPSVKPGSLSPFLNASPSRPPPASVVHHWQCHHAATKPADAVLPAVGDEERAVSGFDTIGGRADLFEGDRVVAAGDDRLHRTV